MGAKSNIEWTDASWTPIRARNKATGRVGWHCVHKSAGCANCYSEGMNMRLGTGLPFKPGHEKDIEIFLDEEMLLAPLRWKRPRNIFVCSMTDAFANFVRDEWLDKMFAVMALAPQHTFQVLIKRSERMREYLGTVGPDDAEDRIFRAQFHVAPASGHEVKDWPLPNVWLGVSCEDQQRADERVPDLLATPAATRFVSAEPLLSGIDFRHISTGERTEIDALTGFQTASSLTVAEAGGSIEAAMATIPSFPIPSKRLGLDMVIVGAESGPRARPMELEWARDIQSQCKIVGTSFFMKQLSGHGGHAIKDMALFPEDLRVRQFPMAA